MAAALQVFTKIDGVDEGPFDGTAGDGALMSSVTFGANYTGSSNDFDIRNILIGSSWGASDIWNPSLASTLVPPFDSQFGTPGDIVVAAGVMTVVNAGVNAYGVYDLGGDYAELYISLDLRVRAAMLTQTSADYFDVFDQNGDQIWGPYNDSSGGWQWDSDLDPVPADSLVAGVWTTLQYHALLDTTPPATVDPVFDGGAAFGIAP